MVPFTTLTALAAPLDVANVDTDQILPAEFLRKPRSAGFSNFLFHRWRFDAKGSEIPGFVLNQPAFRAARVLVTGANFGCGSSRESAVWALIDPPHDAFSPGCFRALVAPSFGDIFYSNASKNGLLCVRLGARECADIRARLTERAGATISIDLPAQVLTDSDGIGHHFDIDPFRKECLLLGVDDIDLTLSNERDIRAWEAERARCHAWGALA